jgi:hypothetical protein
VPCVSRQGPGLRFFRATFFYANSIPTPLRELTVAFAGILHSRSYPVSCMIRGMKIPASLRAAMTEVARQFGKQGGKAAAKNMTPEQRAARAKKAAKAAGEKRTAKRVAREGIKREKQAAKRK